jgi:nitrogen fixation NifU-like protein
MEHYKHPHNRGTLSTADVSRYEKNPFCGDEVTLQLKIDGNVITEAMFTGEACAVSLASSSMVTNFLKGKTIEEASKLSKDDILEMVGVELTTSRVKCATLVLDALESALKEYNGKN